MLKIQIQFSRSLHLLLLDSNETGGPIVCVNVIWSHFIVCFNVEDGFIVAVACDKKLGLRSWRSLKSGGSSLEVYAICVSFFVDVSFATQLKVHNGRRR